MKSHYHMTGRATRLALRKRLNVLIMNFHLCYKQFDKHRGATINYDNKTEILILGLS